MIQLLDAMVLFVLLSIAFALYGRPQMKDGGGTWRRLVGVACYGAALTCAPLVAWGAVAVRDAGMDSAGQVAVIWMGLSCVVVGLLIGPPLDWLRSKHPMPLATDPTTLARVADIARALGIAPPRLRIRGSTSVSLETQAYAGGLVAPSIVATDGILHRLDPKERDAILAHEMAHISTGSLWWLSALPATTGVIGVLIGVSLTEGAALLLSGVLWVGLHRIVSRRTEIACDRAAGRAVGFATTANALAKLHVTIPIEERGVVSALAFATATHPSRAIRLAALRHEASVAERDAIVLDVGAVTRQRTLSVMALVIWLSVIAVGIAFGSAHGGWPWVHGILILVVITPTVLLLAARKRRFRDAARRVRRQTVTWDVRLRRLGFGLVGALIAFVLLTPKPSSEKDGTRRAIGALFVLSAAAIVLWTTAIVGRRARRLRREVEEAMRDRDFARGIALESRYPKRVRRDPVLRYNLAISKAAMGDRVSAIRDLECLARDVPRMSIALSAQADLLVDLDPERAVGIIRDGTIQEPEDPAVHVVAARALRRLARLDEAEAALERGRALDPDGADIVAVAAGLALDRGNVALARRLADEALLRAPGDAAALVARAEVSIAEGPWNAARAAVHAAKDAAAVSPFAFLDGAVRDLEAKLAASQKT
ncbi:MAG: M48 family metalloprotease [Planctomycetes bacterium]|nr:M48 family metalloprotease [Planctomycetota bacterium]